MTRALRIAAATLLILAGAAFTHWDLYHVDPSHPRYVHAHGGPDILQLTAFVWLASAAVFCLLASLREEVGRRDAHRPSGWMLDD
jgi:hypothetical protein